MSFIDYKRTIETRDGHHRLSAVKSKILQRLWDERNSDGGDWVMSSELLALTGQKYFDRRIRELRDETGCAIETGKIGRDARYRLISESLTAGNTRSYLTSSQKADVLLRHGYTCATCGTAFAPTDNRLQADHKVPLTREGSPESSNWQPLCVECNVSKRRACAGCLAECSTCPWAHPELTGVRHVIHLSVARTQKFRQTADAQGRRVDEVIADALEGF